MAKYLSERHQALCAWLTANTIDVDCVPMDTDLTIDDTPDGRLIRYEAIVDDGRRISNERGTGVAIETRTTPLLVEPPAWWRPHVKPTREQAIEQREGAYRERAHLVALLATHYPAVMTHAPDTEEEGWALIFLTIDGHQASWHISPRDLDLFTHVELAMQDDPRVQWDGHTTDEKYERLRHAAAQGRPEAATP